MNKIFQIPPRTFHSAAEIVGIAAEAVAWAWHMHLQRQRALEQHS
jgi:hypothetical protein